MAPEFNLLHSTLLSLSSDVEYVLRWARPVIATDGPYLSGFGVTLDLKKMDYLAVDDRKRAASTTGDHLAGNESQEDNEHDVLSCIFEAMSYIDTEMEKNATTNNPLSTEEIQGSLILLLLFTQGLSHMAQTLALKQHLSFLSFPTLLPPPRSFLHAY